MFDPDTIPLAESLSPEQRLLIACARMDRTVDAVAKCVRHVQSWERLLEEAQRHRVLPMLHHSLSSLEQEGWPAGARDDLRGYFIAHTARVLLLRDALFEILEALREQQVDALVLKGPVLAALVYGRDDLRPYFDLDLLVAPERFPAARAVLTSLGYVMNSDFSEDHAAEYLALRRYLPFLNPASRAVVELHSALLPRYFPAQLPWEALWASAQSVDLAGTTVRTLGPEHLLLALCLHGSKHQWACLSFGADVAQTLKRFPELDVPATAEMARRWGCLRILLTGVRLAYTLLDVEPPVAFRPLLEKTPAARKLADTARHRLFGPASDAPHPASLSLFHMQSLDRFADRLRYASEIVFTPSSGDWNSIPLSGSGRALSRVLRPLRLLITYGPVELTRWLRAKHT